MSTLPPLHEYSLVGIWISAIVYGMNITLYGACLYFIFQRRNSYKWLLFTSYTMLFIVTTMSIGASLAQLIESLITIGDMNIPDASILYWLDLQTNAADIKAVSYDVADILQNLILIWRLYIIYGNSWMVAGLPFVLEIVHSGLALYGTIITVKSTNGVLESGATRPVFITTWGLVLVINISTTMTIAGRLLYMGRHSPDSLSWTSNQSGSAQKNKYLGPVFTIIESGAIFTASNIVLVALYIVTSPKLQTAVNVATQLAATTPYLIIVRSGFGLTHGLDMWKSTVNMNPSSGNSILSLFRAVPKAASSGQTFSTTLDHEAYPLKQISIHQETISETA